MAKIQSAAVGRDVDMEKVKRIIAFLQKAYEVGGPLIRLLLANRKALGLNRAEHLVVEDQWKAKAKALKAKARA